MKKGSIWVAGLTVVVAVWVATLIDKSFSITESISGKVKELI